MSTPTTTCPIRFGWSAGPDGTTIVLTCDLPDGHDGNHAADWHHGLNQAQPTTRIQWLTDDRRSFTGEWERCQAAAARGARCVLPDGHFGTHAA